MQQIWVRATEPYYEPMEVTINLYSALQKLKASYSRKFLWIDAVCINQADLEERASQVRMMRDIYNKASGVIIWLGETTPNLSAAVRTIEFLSNNFLVETSISPSSVVSSTGLCLRSEHLEQLKICTSSVPDMAYTLVAHFFSLPWFRRIWVLQEAFSHITITAHLGPHAISWGSIILAAFWQANLTRKHTAASTNRPDGLTARQYLPELWLGLLHTRTPRGLSMIELVSRARDFEASDPRDKVFALLGLANDLGLPETRSPGLLPNYKKTKSEIYTTFAKDLILETNDLHILSLVNTFIGRRQTRELVSWMPDLDTSLATIRGLGFPSKYNASFSTIAQPVSGRTENMTTPTLSLHGLFIDSVHYVTESIITFSRDLKLRMNANVDAIMELWKMHVRPLSRDTLEDQLLKSYIELLTAAGFALPTEFPAQPLGKVVPSCEVPSLMSDFAAYWARLEPSFITFEKPNRSYLIRQAERGDADQFGVLAGKACHERKFFITAKGRMGLCPRDTEVGDDVVVLYGGSVPYVLAAKSDHKWAFVGECYVDGIMFGEAQDLKRREQIFHIV